MTKKEKLQVLASKDGFPVLYSESGNIIRTSKSYMYESKDGYDTGKYYPLTEVEIEVFDNFKDASDWTKKITTS